MTPDDKKPFAEIVTGFAELKGKSLSKAALSLFWNSMQHWDIDDFRAAANQLVRSCEFMPTPKDFEDLRKAGRPTAGEAWALVRQHAKGAIQCGQIVHSHSCGDRFIDRCANAIGGYGAVAMCDSDKLHFLEKRFAEHFATMQESEDIREAVPQIAHSRARLNGPTKAGDIMPRLGQE